MATYSVRYLVLPPGTGPDDYESGDLESRTTEVELSAPEPVGVVSGGAVLSYGPERHEVRAALRGELRPGEEPIVLQVDLV